MTSKAETHRPWLDAALFWVVSLAAFYVYWLTLYPGPGGGGDSVKFQYLGRVLGTAHPPGYPLYVLVSHVFSWLPFDPLAYRINLMSACFAALTAGFVCLSVREAGGGRLAGITAGLGLAFGRAFWSKAVVAEVYTLGSCLLAAVFWLTMRWRRTRRDRDLLVAVGVAALALGNHLTIAFVVPALVAYVLLVDWRQATRARVIGLTVLLVLAGLAQYGFIILRTIQHAPFLEATATNLGELIDVITARRVAGDMFAYSPAEIVLQRVPELSPIVFRELHVIGLVLMASGLAWLAVTRPKEAVLIGGGALGAVFVTLNVWADMEGFAVPIFVLAWALAGAGVEGAGRLAALTRRRRLSTACALALAVTVPVLQLWRNYAANDHHLRTFETRYFQALFEELPDRSAIVSEAYSIDEIVRYKLIGEEAAGGRDIKLIPRSPDDVRARLAKGDAVFAFDLGREQLEPFGMTFEPVSLSDLALPEYLRSIRVGSIVALAASPGAAHAFGPADAASLRHLGARESFFGRLRQSYGVIGVAGSSGPALEHLSDQPVELDVDEGRRVGETGVTTATPLRARASSEGVSISVGGKEVARAAQGLALAIVTPGGALVGAATIDTRRTLRVPFDMGPLPLFRVVSASQCADIGNQGWVDVTAAASATRLVARIDNYRPFDSTFVFYVAAAGPFDLALAETGGHGRPAIDLRAFDLPPAGTLAEVLAQDGLTDAGTILAAARVYRVAITVNDDGQFATATFRLSGPPTRAFARATVDLDNPRRATLCGD